jgi:hypothetical protein
VACAIVDLEMDVGGTVLFLNTNKRGEHGSDLLSNRVLIGVGRFVRTTRDQLVLVRHGISRAYMYVISSRRTSLSPAQMNNGGRPPKYPVTGETQGWHS